MNRRTRDLVLDCLKDQPLHLREIARRTRLSTDTTSRVLHSLVKRGILSVEEKGRKKLFRILSIPLRNRHKSDVEKLNAPIIKGDVDPLQILREEREHPKEGHSVEGPRRGITQEDRKLLNLIKKWKATEGSEVNAKKPPAEEENLEDDGPTPEDTESYD